MTRVYFGYPGHFCASHNCRWHLHTHVNGWCVSTVGDYHPRSNKESDPPETVGVGRYYETYVAPIAAGSEEPGAGEVVCGYNDHKDAEQGHELHVQMAERGTLAVES